MANKRIVQLPLKSVPADGDHLPIDDALDNNVTKRVTVGSLIERARASGNLLDAIPSSLHAAIRDRTVNEDLSQYINPYLQGLSDAGGALVTMPAGLWTVSAEPLIMRSRVHLIGDGYATHLKNISGVNTGYCVQFGGYSVSGGHNDEEYLAANPILALADRVSFADPGDIADFAVGDAIFIASEEGFFHLDYDNETQAFTVGDTITGAVSGATAEIESIADEGTTGTLDLMNGNGVMFLDGEQITGASQGVAQADGNSTNTGGIPEFPTHMEINRVIAVEAPFLILRWPVFEAVDNPRVAATGTGAALDPTFGGIASVVQDASVTGIRAEPAPAARWMSANGGSLRCAVRDVSSEGDGVDLLFAHLAGRCLYDNISGPFLRYAVRSHETTHHNRISRVGGTWRDLTSGVNTATALFDVRGWGHALRDLCAQGSAADTLYGLAMVRARACTADGVEVDAAALASGLVIISGTEEQPSYGNRVLNVTGRVPTALNAVRISSDSPLYNYGNTVRGVTLEGICSAEIVYCNGNDNRISNVRADNGTKLVTTLSSTSNSITDVRSLKGDPVYTVGKGNLVERCHSLSTAALRNMEESSIPSPAEGGGPAVRTITAPSMPMDQLFTLDGIRVVATFEWDNDDGTRRAELLVNDVAVAGLTEAPASGAPGTMVLDIDLLVENASTAICRRHVISSTGQEQRDWVRVNIDNDLDLTSFKLEIENTSGNDTVEMPSVEFIPRRRFEIGS